MISKVTPVLAKKNIEIARREIAQPILEVRDSFSKK
jgi:hypothetical protein